MTLAATIQADVLQNALAPVGTIVDECKLQANDGGLSITAVDPANVAMVDMELNASACAHWSAGGETIGVNLERLVDVLSMADSDDMVSLELDAETRKLEIEIGGLEFTMATIDQTTIREEPDIPDLELPGTYIFDGRALTRAVTAADLCSDHIEIIGHDAEFLEFHAEGDTDDVSVDLTDDELLSGRHESDDAVSSLFSLDYLQDIKGPIGADTDVSLLVGDEFPIKLRYSLADGDVSVLFMLAPRIQSEGQ